MIKILTTLFSLLCTSWIAQSQTLLQDLPILNNYSLSFQQSSYDRTGLNVDYISSSDPNYYDAIPHGRVNNPSGSIGTDMEYVICHIQGPAVLERFWMITFPPIYVGAKIRFYFDGENTPRIDETFNDLFLSQKSPFNKPLVQEFNETSGGNYAFIPMNIAQSLIVTIDVAGLYYQFQARQLPRDTIVESWTPFEDHSDLIQEFNQSGSYPKSNWNQSEKDSISLSIAPLEQKELFLINGQQSIESIQMQISDLDYSWSDFTKDKGRFHKGISKFIMNINGAAEKVVLVKRSNKTYHAVTNFAPLYEQAALRVNNTLVRNWRTTNYRAHRYWQNDTIEIPKNIFQNKSLLNVQLNHNGGEDWNEYYYWIICDGVVTDSLDVGNSTSETAHQYTVTNSREVPYNEINNRYDAPQHIKNANRQILDSLYIHIYFDNESIPSISAPIGLFFGTGVNDVAYMKSIPCGNVDGWYYNYFTMPFWKNARVVLENKSQRNIENINTKWSHLSHGYDKDEVGYFKTYLRKETKLSSDTTDYLVANINGRGVYVGTVIEANQNDNTITCWLEGDEFIYIDGAETPSFYGTGTEDYFNSTFYFYFDEYSMPQNGMTNSDYYFHRSMYRFHLSDPIHFQKSLRFQIEHGDYNNKLGNYQSLAFYYWQPSETILTDSLNIGNSNSESLHHYTTSNRKVRLQKSLAFETGKYYVKNEMFGYAIPDSSSWTARIIPENKGVRLLRQFDYSIKNQQAKVYVDDMYVGEWLNPGQNTNGFARDDFFDIPAQFTRNKSSLQIKIVNASDSVMWTELNYEVFTRKDNSIVTDLPISEQEKFFTVFPTITKDFVQIRNSSSKKWTWQLYHINGQLLQQNTEREGISTVNIKLLEYKSGMYLVRVSTEENKSQTEKIILIK